MIQANKIGKYDYLGTMIKRPGQEYNIWWTMMKTGGRRLNTGTCFSVMWWTSWGKVWTWRRHTQRRRSTGQWEYCEPMHSRLSIPTWPYRVHLARQCIQPSPSYLTLVSAMQGRPWFNLLFCWYASFFSRYIVHPDNRLTLRAMVDIKKGEEITIQYISFLFGNSKR